MEMEQRLATVQLTYAASVAETVNTYGKLGVLAEVVQRRKAQQGTTAPMMIKRLGIGSVEQVFTTISELYGCANWQIEQTEEGYEATATSCMLCALAKKAGGADPCRGWCLDPLSAMIEAVGGIPEEQIAVKSTLMDHDCCKVVISST